MSTIEEAFKARIEALNTAVGERIYREVIEQRPSAMPALSFVRTGGSPMPRLLETRQPCLQRVVFRVEVVTDDAAAVDVADGVADSLRSGLDGWIGTSAGVDILHCSLDFQGDASIADGDLFLKVIQQDYTVVHR